MADWEGKRRLDGKDIVEDLKSENANNERRRGAGRSAVNLINGG